ncbi:MAG: glutamate--tRNA ligase [Actinomycetota bacterium]
MNSKGSKTRVRFAPSPTGHLHIGSARTAYFNWLFARKTGGNFILRIEDTDIARHIEPSLESLQGSLKWLGLGWDEGYGAGGKFGPYRQSERKALYQEYARNLLDKGKAYRCFCSPEDLKEKRKQAEKKGKTYKYDRHCLNRQKDMEKKLACNQPHAVRILLPDNQDISFTDTVYGNISVNTKQLDDFIILRSNGLPTYNFSAAVDDALMEISHVIRGEDHLSNTPKQIIIYNLFGFPVPGFTHLPMILGDDGQKLSKRHGSVSIEEYRRQGILPEAILNYLALLGWSYSGKEDTFSVEEAIEKFDLKDINKKPARFDYQKLLWLNGCYIRKLDQDRLAGLIAEKVKSSLQEKDLLEGWDRDLEEKIKKIVPLIRERLKTVSETMDWISPFFIRVSYSEEAARFFDLKKTDAPLVLKKTIEALEKEDEFAAANLEQAIRKLAEGMDLGLRNYAQVVRMALWGSKVSPPLFGTMEILGKDLTLARLKKYLHTINTKA